MLVLTTHKGMWFKLGKDIFIRFDKDSGRVYFDAPSEIEISRLSNQAYLKEKRDRKADPALQRTGPNKQAD